ncbi:aminodeoxychorismate/anthranilate synthase component II [Sesbania bispinosa]|nr:aminodeoxychorismate/anthranilate synthase component II [Sesbania bispinosa]
MAQNQDNPREWSVYPINPNPINPKAQIGGPWILHEMEKNLKMLKSPQNEPEM